MSRIIKINKNPSSLAMRICECGCGNVFLPNRSDQIYLNYKHANFAYNHGPRKEKYAEETFISKVVRKNDRIIEKYHKLSDKTTLVLNLVLLRAEGFLDNIYTSVIDLKSGETEFRYHALYNYCFRIIIQGNINYIEIRKL